MGKLFAKWVLSSPRVIVVLGIVATLATGFGVGFIKLNNDLKDVIAKDNPVRVALERLDDVFGSSETLAVQVGVKGGDVYSAQALSDVYTVTKKLKRLKTVSRVQSLATADKFARDEEGGLQIEKMLASKPAGDADAAAVKAAVESDGDIRRAFVSEDRRSTAIYIDPKAGADDEAFLNEVRKITDESLGAYDLHVAGLAAVRMQTNQVIYDDLLLLGPIVAVVLILFLWISLRNVTGVIITLLLVSSSILPAAGVMGLLGIPISAQTTTFPVLILAIVVGDAIHLLSTYYSRLRQGKDKLTAVRETAEELSLPVFLTSATSAAGFMGMLTSPLPQMIGLGIAVAVGIMWAWVLSAFVLPAGILLLPVPKVPPSAQSTAFDRAIDRFMERLMRHPLAAMLAVVSVVLVLAGIGLPRIEREVSPERIFPAGTPIREATASIDAAFRSGAPVDLLIEGDVRDPALFAKMDRFARRVREIPEVGSVDSAAGIVSRIQETLTGEPGIPADPDRLAQTLLLYQMSGSPDRYQRLISTDGRFLRMTIRMPSLETEELESVLAQVETIRAEELPEVKSTLTGPAILVAELSRLSVISLLQSLTFAMVLVFFICAIAFRSVIDGLHSMAPLSLAILGVFAAMGLTGIPLTIATALITSIVIGVGVDFGIHFMARWNLLRGMTDKRVRAHETILEVGKPILANTFAVAGGLAVLAISEFEPIRQLGLMAVFAMLASGAGAIVLLPLMKIIRHREVPMSKATLVAFFVLLVASVASADESRALLEKAQKVGTPKTMQSTMVMALKDSGGREKTRSLKLQKVGEDKQLVWFVQPADLAGTAFLRLGGAKDRKMWLYLPAFKKLERISGSKENESFLGSDFTYADMADRDLDKFEHKPAGEAAVDGKAATKVESTLKGDDEDAPYKKIVSYVEKDNGKLVREDLYDQSGELVKRKTHEAFKTIGAYVIPSVIVMTDLANKHSTRIEMKNVEVDKAIADNVFTTEAMKRIRP